MSDLLYKFIHRNHPWIKIKYLFSSLKNKKKEFMIPKDTHYCYDENGPCPFIRRIESNKDNHGFSPFSGFRWCTFLNQGDYPDLNDRCKICDVSIPDFEEE